MRIFVPKEYEPSETRIPLVPATAKKLVSLGAELSIEIGLGERLGFSNAEYEKVGAQLVSDTSAGFSSANIVLRLRKPDLESVSKLPSGCLHISHLDPFYQKDLVEKLAHQGVTAICMELIPRSTIAQKMDALSSQANLAGYVAVLLAAKELDKALPMMMTPSGTIKPAKVFIIGVGVAGLQAIATAKRLGARVEAFDTRPVVEEQVKSLGARFVKVDLGETGQTKDGYAKALTEEQMQKQQEAMAKVCSQSDVVITTAQVFGRKAPVIVKSEMVNSMRAGSVIVDLAVETGGNVEGSELNKIANVNGVKIVGLANLPGQVPVHSSEMYANNLGNLLEHFWDKEKKTFNLDLEDEILKGCVVTHDKKICNEMLLKRYAG